MKRADIEALAAWESNAEPSDEIAFARPRAAAGLHRRARRRRPRGDARRDEALGGDPTTINPLQPVELVIDHSVQVDEFGIDATRSCINARARVRAQPGALRVPALGPDGVPELPVVPPGHGHRPPGEPRVPRRASSSSRDEDGATVAYPDTLVGTDSHTTMINGLGVLGWGVGGIEAEAAMLGQPVSMLIPQVVGFKLHRRAAGRARRRPTSCSPSPRCSARRGSSASSSSSSARASRTSARRPRDDRQHGARVRRDLRHLPGRRGDAPLPAAHRPPERAGRSSSRRTPRSRGSSARRRRAEPMFTDTLELDLGTVEPSLAGPKRPQDRVPLSRREAVRLTKQTSRERDAPRSAPARHAPPPRVRAHG